MKMESWINVSVLLLFVGALIMAIIWVNDYMETHKCDNPYKQVCVKSHTVTRVVPVFVNINGKTQTQMRPAIIRECDEYKTVLKEGCNDNTYKKAD